MIYLEGLAMAACPDVVEVAIVDGVRSFRTSTGPWVIWSGDRFVEHGLPLRTFTYARSSLTYDADRKGAAGPEGQRIDVSLASAGATIKWHGADLTIPGFWPFGATTEGNVAWLFGRPSEAGSHTFRVTAEGVTALDVGNIHGVGYVAGRRVAYGGYSGAGAVQGFVGWLADDGSYDPLYRRASLWPRAEASRVVDVAGTAEVLTIATEYGILKLWPTTQRNKVVRRAGRKGRILAFADGSGDAVLVWNGVWDGRALHCLPG